MLWLTIAVALYGLLVALGGIIGFATAGSISSLLTGGTIGLLLLAAAAVSRSNVRLGFAFATGLALVVIGLFIKRYIDTQKPMPAFGIIGLSVLMLVLLTVGHFMYAAQRNAGSVDTTPSTQG